MSLVRFLWWHWSVCVLCDTELWEISECNKYACALCGLSVSVDTVLCSLIEREHIKAASTEMDFQLCDA